MNNNASIRLNSTRLAFALLIIGYTPASYSLSLPSLGFGSLAKKISSYIYGKPAAHSKPAPTTHKNKEIVVCADIEGDPDKFSSFIEKSDAFNVTVDEFGCLDLSFKQDSTMFVFIGDAIDKGIASFKIIVTLIKLKERYPDRVILLLGNRDINKLRLSWELMPSALDLSNPETKFSLDRFRLGEWEDKFEAWIAQGKNKIDGVVVEYQHGKKPATDIILKLKWILEQTMGDPDNFDDFKQELGLKNDTDACLAYIMFVQRFLYNYLLLAQMAYLDEDTGALFVHGGLSKESFGYIPETELGKCDHRKIEIQNMADLRLWVQELNKWAREQITWGIRGNALKTLPIIQYQEPTVITKANGKTGWGTPNKISVIHGRPWDGSYNLAGLQEDIALTLVHCGVNKLLFGHSPVGQVPVILKTDLSAHHKSLFISVATDTSVTKPARNAAIKVTRDAVTVCADYYGAPADKATADTTTDSQAHKPLALVYSSADSAIGTAQIIGDKKYWTISSELKAHWRSVNNMPFGLPEYVLG
jgi:hypothetical protein